MKPTLSVSVSILIAALLACLGAAAVFVLPVTGLLVGRAAEDAELPLIASVLAGIVFGIAAFRVCSWWFNKGHLFARGSQHGRARMSPLKWWFVGMNLLLSAAAAFPSSLYLVPWTSQANRLWVRIASVVAFVLGMLGCELGYIACLFVLFSICALLLTPGIPCRVKLATAFLELTACGLLFWDTQRTRTQHPSCAPFGH